MKIYNQNSMLISLVLISILVLAVPGVAQEGHHEMAENQCDEATQEAKVVADPDNDGSNKFSTIVINSEPGTCLNIEFENGSSSDQHSFAIDAATTTLEHTVHLHIMNSSMGHKTINIQIPDQETTIPFFCNVSDHRDDGMVGQIVVESPGILPGFTFYGTLSALTVMLIAIPILRRKN